MFTSQAQVKTSLVMCLMWGGGKPRTIKLLYSLMGRLSRSDKEPAFQIFFKRYLTVLRYCTCCCSTPLGLSNALTLSLTHTCTEGERGKQRPKCVTQKTHGTCTRTLITSQLARKPMSLSLSLSHILMGWRTGSFTSSVALIR